MCQWGLMRKDVPTPLVLDFHGVGGNSLFQEKDSNFTGNLLIKESILHKKLWI